MRLLAYTLPAVLAALAPATAHANQCDAGRSLLSNREIPVGCPIRAYVRPSTQLADVRVVVGTTDVTATVTAVGPIDLPIHYDEPDFANECNARSYVAPYTYAAYDLTFTANVGETMEIGGGYRTATVVAAGPCPAPEDYSGTDWIQCSAAVQEYWECHDQLCTPFATDPACESNGSNDNPTPPGDDDESVGCAASNGASLASLGGPLGLVVVAFVRSSRKRKRRSN
jgi:hypothetical protein